MPYLDLLFLHIITHVHVRKRSVNQFLDAVSGK